MENSIGDPFGKFLGGIAVQILKMIEGAGAVLRDDIHGEEAPPPALRDQLLGTVEIALAEAVFLEDVAPSAGGDLEIKSRLDFEDAVAERLQFLLVGPQQRT